MTREAPIPIVLCFDVEPDERFVDRRNALPWTGFEKLYAHLSALRARFAERHGVQVRLSWFLRMDPQVKDTHGDAAWAARRYEGRLAEVAATGDDVGLHIHAYRWDDAADHWVVDHDNRAWIDECVQMSADAYRGAFGRPCGSYRMGDRYLDNATLALIEHPHTGSLPDMRAAPRQAYRPSREDFLRADPSSDRRISMLPLSTWKVPGLLAIARRAFVTARMLRKSPIPDVLKRHGMMTLGLSLPPFVFRRMLDDLLAAEPVAHLVSIDRSHIGNEPEKLNRIAVNLRHMLSHPMAHRFAFARPEEVVDSLPFAQRAASPGEATVAAR